MTRLDIRRHGSFVRNIDKFTGSSPPFGCRHYLLIKHWSQGPYGREGIQARLDMAEMVGIEGIEGIDGIDGIEGLEMFGMDMRCWGWTC